MKNKKDLTDDNMTGMPKPDFDINHNPFRDGDSLVDAVRAVLSGQPVTQEQAKELEKENPSALKDKRTQQEEQVNVEEGYEKTVLNHLAKNKIKGRFEKGKLYIDKKDEKTAKAVLSSFTLIKKIMRNKMMLK